MNKKLTPLQKLTTGYKREFHPWPFIIGIIGNLIVALAVPLGGALEPFTISGEGNDLIGQLADVVLFLTIPGIAAGMFSSVCPLISGLALLILMLIDTSAFLSTFDGLGLIGSFALLLASGMCFRLRKDLLKKWGW